MRTDARAGPVRAVPGFALRRPERTRTLSLSTDGDATQRAGRTHDTGSGPPHLTDRCCRSIISCPRTISLSDTFVTQFRETWIWWPAYAAVSFAAGDAQAPATLTQCHAKRRTNMSRLRRASVCVSVCARACVSCSRHAFTKEHHRTPATAVCTSRRSRTDSSWTKPLHGCGSVRRSDRCRRQCPPRFSLLSFEDSSVTCHLHT